MSDDIYYTMNLFLRSFTCNRTKFKCNKIFPFLFYFTKFNIFAVCKLSLLKRHTIKYVLVGCISDVFIMKYIHKTSSFFY